MLIDINPNIKLPEYKLVLHKLDETPLQELKNIQNLEYKAYYVGIDELTFSIPKYREDLHGRVVENEIYDLVEGDFLIKVNDSKFFIIINVKEDSDGTSTTKSVIALSREYELTNKKLVNYEAVSRKLYDPTNSMLDGLELGILNYIFNNITKGWTIGDYDVDVLEKYRALSFSSNNLIEVFQTLQTTYNCIFKFDTINQTIDILDFDNAIGQNKGLYISDGNFINNLSKTLSSDEIKTRLFLYGENNVSVQEVNITRQPYIDNFSFYRNDKYMSTDLQNALNLYDTAILTWQPQLNTKLDDKNVINSKVELCRLSTEPILNDDLIEIAPKGLMLLNTDLAVLQTQIDVKVDEKATKQNSISRTTDTGLLPQLHSDLAAIQTELDGLEEDKAELVAIIDAVNNYIISLNAQIESLNTDILTIQSNLNLNIFFTNDLLKELDRYIKVETYNDSSYTENNIQELYEEGQKLLSRISTPNIQFNLDVVDFLQLVEAQHIWNKFILGDIVNLSHKDIKFEYEVRLVGYVHNVDDYSLLLTFSNTNSVDDATLYLRDLLENVSNTNATIDFNKYKWAKAANMESVIAQYVDDKLEESRQNILSAVGQKHLFDDSGLWLYALNGDGTIKPEQIRAINNTIALTKNNWASVGTAITPDGIVAEQIYGKLGAFATVNANQVSVGGVVSYDYTVQPVPPYYAGELWLDGSTVKVCTNSRTTGGFQGSDWEVTIISEVEAIDATSVKKNTLYNAVKITEAKGIEVFDNLGSQRVQLGNYESGKYGLLLKDSIGNRTILDDRGIMQTWQEGRTDNVQSGFPITLYVYLPTTTRIINKAILRFNLSKFRAHSTATSTENARVITSSSGGASERTSSAGGSSTATTQAVTIGGTTGSGINVVYQSPPPTTTNVNGHTHQYNHVQSHGHNLNIEPHSHTINTRHNHTVIIDDHNHSINIPSHSHNITYGIYESTSTPTAVNITINGVNRTSALGGGAGFNSAQSNLNITSYLTVGTWNSIQFSSSTLGRIDATVFIQALMNIEN